MEADWKPPPFEAPLPRGILSHYYVYNVLSIHPLISGGADSPHARAHASMHAHACSRPTHAHYSPTHADLARMFIHRMSFSCSACFCLLHYLHTGRRHQYAAAQHMPRHAQEQQPMQRSPARSSAEVSSRNQRPGGAAVYGPRAPMYDPRASPVSQQQRLAQQSNVHKVSKQQQKQQKVAVAEAYTHVNTIINRHAEPNVYEIMVDHGGNKVWRCICRTCHMSNMHMCFYTPASTHVVHFSAHKRSSCASSIAIHVSWPGLQRCSKRHSYLNKNVLYIVCACVCVRVFV